MRKHLALWAVALIAAAVAAALWLARRGNEEPPPLTPTELVQRAMLELDGDPAASDVWTQSVLRAAAVEVEAGRVLTAEGDYLLAMQYQRERNVAAAEALFKRAILRKPAWSRAYAGLANLLGRYSVGRLDEAEKEARKAVELEPNWGRGHDILAVILRLAGRFKDAEAEAKRAVACDPLDAAPRNNYANLLLEMKRYKDAEAQYRAAIVADGENARPHYNLAVLFARTDRFKEAVKSLKTAIELAPNLREEAAADPELDDLRGRTDFEKLVAASPAPPADTKLDPRPTKPVKKKTK